MEDKVYDLLEKMYIEFMGKFSDVNSRFDRMDSRFDSVDLRFDKVEEVTNELKEDVKELKVDVMQINATIEHDIKPKLTVLFDGHIQHTQQLERIELEVSRHEEIILRRVK